MRSYAQALDHAAEVLRRFEIEPKPLDRLFSEYLSRHREIASRERRLIGYVIFGVMRWRSRLDGAACLAGMKKPTARDRVHAFLAWKPWSEQPFEVDLPWLSDLNLLSGPMPERFPGGEAAWSGFPPILFDQFVRERGKDAAFQLMEALNHEACPVLRVNTLKNTREELLQELARHEVHATPTTRSPFGIRLEHRIDLASIPAFREGRVELQDESSQLAAILADPQPGDRVLDACAGAGGKSLLLAMLMHDRGSILAVDCEPLKLQELSRRVRRAGINSITGKRGDMTEVWKGDRNFDLVVVDAPCSGSGTLRRSPDLKWRLSRTKVTECADLQRRMVLRCRELVRPGGRLLYATCSLLQEENEAVIEDLVRQGGFRVVPAQEVLQAREIDPDGITTHQGYLSLDPSRGEWDGFFAALLERIGERA